MEKKSISGRESLKDKRVRAALVYEKFIKSYLDLRCTLNYKTPFQLLVMTILAAQCTDERVNKVTKPIFAQYPGPEELLTVLTSKLEQMIHSCGFYRAKAQNIHKTCKALVEEFSGKVPGTMEELLKLPGVGRKTANVILGECYGVPGVIVDTHCTRLARRLGFTRQEDAVKIEHDLMRIWEKETWTLFSHCMVFHGRAVCNARSPKCSACCVRELCPFPDSREGARIAQ